VAELDGSGGLSELESRITRAVDAIAPSVAVVRGLRARGRPEPYPGGPGSQQGSAVVIDRAGRLLTNEHVVDGATDLTVRLADGREVPASVVGADPGTDVALVRIEAEGLVPARLGDSEGLRVGQVVLAVGHALGLPGGPTVSFGLVSALARPLPGSDFIFEGLLQTDAAINPGNSGGPLVDLEGRVVGLNAAMIPFAQGVGFAIPIHAASRVAEELARRGRVVRPWIGVSVAEIGPELAARHALEVRSGLLIAEVVARSPSHRAGLRPGDVLSRVGPFRVRSVRELLEALSKYPIGGDVEVEFRRRGALQGTSLPLQEIPPAAGRRG
jgi:serine protease Do